MSDLLTSLIIPQGSQESFHSFHSSQSRPNTPPTASSSNLHTIALQAAGLPFHDVDSYLNHPEKKAMLSSTSKSSTSSTSKKPKTSKAAERLDPQPVPLGTPKTSHYTVAFYQLCQERGFVPQFEIDGNDFDGFGGWLKVGNETIGSEERWRTKKSAKEGLAQKGLGIVKDMDARIKSSAAQASEKNWIGLLQEYHDTLGHGLELDGPNYVEYAVAPGFACTCTIPSHGSTFGSVNAPFTSKKAARANAAKEAIEYLIAKGLTNPDGSVTRKKSKPGTTTKLGERGLEVKRDATYAQRVNELCPLLGLTAPTYRLTASSSETPSLLSGAAYFPGDPVLHGGIGEVRSVYGKKNAKEECARGVWEVLTGLARKRGVEIEISEEEENGV